LLDLLSLKPPLAPQSPSFVCEVRAKLDTGMAQRLDRIRRLNGRNLATVRSAPLAEISGSLGDLGTLLPLMIALAIQGSIQLGSTLVFTGAFNIVTGILFGIPLPVQPMKVWPSAAIHACKLLCRAKPSLIRQVLRP
jgi:hypothetical protein